MRYEPPEPTPSISEAFADLHPEHFELLDTLWDQDALAQLVEKMMLWAYYLGDVGKEAREKAEDD